MKRHNQILAGVLAFQIILSIVVFWPGAAGAAKSEPVFPGLESSAIVALTITDDGGTSIQFRQVTGNWVIPEADDFPAQADKITPLLDKIAGLTADRLVARTEASQTQLQVTADNFVRRIDFEAVDGAKHTLYLGSSPSYGATHFRVDGQSETYLTDKLTSWEISAAYASWIDVTYLGGAQADVTKMTLENANGTFIFTKNDAGSWTMVGLAADETLDQAKVTTLLGRASSVNMVRPLGKEEKPDYGLEQPSAVVTLETANEAIALRVGAKDPADNSYVVISSESPYYVRVAESGVKVLVSYTRGDFLQLPATPTPEGGSSTP